METINVNRGYVNANNNGRYLNVISLYIINVTFSIMTDIIHLTNTSIKNETSNTTPHNGNVLFDTISSSSLGWISGNSYIAEDIIYNLVHQDYNTLLQNRYNKISWVEIINNNTVIVLVVILDEYKLLTCLMILTIISSSDAFQFNDLMNDNSSNNAVSYLMTNIILLSQINIVTQALHAVF